MRDTHAAVRAAVNATLALPGLRQELQVLIHIARVGPRRSRGEYGAVIESMCYDLVDAAYEGTMRGVTAEELVGVCREFQAVLARRAVEGVVGVVQRLEMLGRCVFARLLVLATWPWWLWNGGWWG